MRSYLDTSFLVSLYAPDANSIAAAARMGRSAGPFLTSSLGEIECANAIELRRFRRELPAPEARAALAAFEADAASGVFAILPLPAAVYSKARELSRRHTARLGTRTLDILHVAAALDAEAKAFLTFDRNQRKLAQAEGLLIP